MNLGNDLPVVIGHLLVSDPLELVVLFGKGQPKNIAPCRTLMYGQLPSGSVCI
jgi:hypothetical protein